jgi:hypothetical protein
VELLGLTELELWPSQESDVELEFNVNWDDRHWFWLFGIKNLQKKG